MEHQDLNITYGKITDQLTQLHSIVSSFQNELGEFLENSNSATTPKQQKAKTTTHKYHTIKKTYGINR